ncbi:CDP-diacylglycerol diphosphatase [Pseudomonas oryzihabitans]|uniref:CDP-diacylglycerol diphosphatase n=1 Tax=Pseudomonas oryzihabitans TaxID=47885 RepID=UPI00209539B3|nr:CDP-diacylglycerol diphosphatase [Pseudomonas psychrotolerans]
MADLPLHCPDSHWKRSSRSCSLPPSIRSSWRRLPWLLMLGVALTGCASRDLLRQVTTGLCVPNARLTGLATPCRQVVKDPGFAVLRAPGERQHFILVPLRPLRGLESPALWQPGQPNWFGLAWRQRWYLSAWGQAPVADERIALALNAPSGRSQDQLHVHLACLRPEVREQLSPLVPELDEHWRALPMALAGGRYQARRLSEAQLLPADFFQALASQPPYPLPDPRLSLAVVALPSRDASRQFLLLAGRAGSQPGDQGSAERLLVADCQGTTGAPATQ